ncbi:MAG: caspase family protein [Candidatus Kapabacteria bacterium]|jgi:hypothetical protein|nr:caspase family protein [Candidatus Kapabacteria bacterium]
MKTFLRFCGVVYLLTSFIAMSAAAQSQVFKVLVTKGKVEVQHDEKGAWDKVSTGNVLGADDKLRIAKGGYASITYIASGKTFELSAAGTHEIRALMKEAVALSQGKVSQLASFVLKEMAASDATGNYKNNMNTTASVDRSFATSKKNVLIPTDNGKASELYKGSYALLVGASGYTEGWPRLPGVPLDIGEVKQALEEHGFTTIVINDPDHNQLQDAFKNFINKYCMDVENRVIFYFAGHGHTMRQSYGEEMGYLIPVDAPSPVKNPQGFLAKAMAMQQLEVYAKQIQSKHALFLFDACFSGSIFALSRAIPENISYKTTKPVRQFITSGSADETVPDKSVFREQLIAALNGEADGNNDGFVTGTELGEFLQDRVVNYSRNSQHPQYGKIRNPNLDKGDFVFNVRVTVTMKPDETGAMKPVVSDVRVEEAAPSATAAARPVQVPPTAPGVQLGVRGGLNFSTMAYDENVSFLSDDPEGDVMSGLGFHGGITATIPFSDAFGLMVNAGYDARTLKINLYEGLNEGDSFAFSLPTISADILLRLMLGNAWVAGGASLSLYSEGTFTETITIGSSPLVISDKVLNYESLGLAAKIALGYDVYLSGNIVLAPELSVAIPLTSVRLGYDYIGDPYITSGQILVFQGGLGLRFRL